MGHCDCVDRVVSTAFRALGRQIAKTPGYFVIVPILVAALLGSGLQRIRYEDDPEYLFTPTNGRSKTERKIVESLFPMNSSRNFDLGRITRPGHFGRVIAVPRDDGSILRPEIFNEIDELNMIVQNLTIYYEDRTWKYEDLCARRETGICFTNEVMELKGIIYEMGRNPAANMTYPLMVVDGKLYFLGGAFGGVDTDENDVITNCRAINLMYYLDWDTPRTEQLAKLWEATFLETIDSLEFEHIDLAMYVSNTLTKELQRNTQSILPFISVTLAIMLSFSVATCMMADWVSSKPWLGVLGCVSSIMGVGAAFGLIMYFNLEFIGINLAAPFLMLGIGMDDSFVILAAWRRTDPKLGVVERMGETYADAAVSVTITSLTNFISFWIGAITPFPSVRIFCIYTAIAVLFTYAYQITFFGGCMALFGICEQKGLHSMFCVPVTPKSLSTSRNYFYRILCTGGKNPDDPDNPMDNKEHRLMVFFRDQMGTFLCNTSVKVLVIICFMAYLAVGIWGCLQVREGLERHKLSRSDSYSVTFYDREDRYFRKYGYRIQVLVNATLNYADPEVQDQIENMLQEFEASPYCAHAELTESWLRAFNKFTADGRTSFLLQSFNKSDPKDFLHILDVFLNYPMLEFFRQDIKFNEDQSKIVGSRFVVQAFNITNANEEKDMVIALREIADRQPFPVTVFQQYFIYFDQFILVRDTSIQSICVAVAVMIAISLIFIPSVHCAIFVAFCIISIEIGVIGYMTLWGVNLDTISMINLIMCIGFSVDYSAHISYAYFSAEKRTPDDGIKAALHSLGLPIFQGSVSTILGVIALVFAPSYIFLTFFKTVFLVITFAALHGMLLLPVCLSLSDSCFNANKCLTCRKPQSDCICLMPPPEKPPISTIPALEPKHYGATAAVSGGKNGQPVRIITSNGFIAPVTNIDMDKNSTQGGGKGDDAWSAENGDKDLGLGTSGESSDGSLKCPHEDATERAIIPPPKPQQTPPELPERNHRYFSGRGAMPSENHVNAAYVPDEEMMSVRVIPDHQDNYNFQMRVARTTPNHRSSSCEYPRDRMRSYMDEFPMRRPLTGRLNHVDYRSPSVGYHGRGAASSQYYKGPSGAPREDTRTGSVHSSRSRSKKPKDKNRKNGGDHRRHHHQHERSQFTVRL